MIDSVILNENEKDTFFKLMKESNENIGNEFELIFRGSRDGCEASYFHKNFDNKEKTVIIIHIDSDNIFGGLHQNHGQENFTFKKIKMLFYF